MGKTLLTRLAYALLLTIGISTAWGFVAVWGFMIREAAFPRQDKYQRIVRGSDGTPVIETAKYYGTEPATYADLDGHEYQEDNDDWRNTMYQDAVLIPFAAPTGGSRAHTSHRMSVFHSTTQPGTLWYFIDSGNGEGGWFEGYATENRRLAGYLGVNGPSASRPEGPDRFAAPPGALNYTAYWSEQNYFTGRGVPIPFSMNMMVTGPLARHVCVPLNDNVLLVDLQNGGVRKLFAEPRAIRALQVTRSADRRNKEARLLTLTPRSILVFDDKFQQSAEYVLPEGEDARYLRFTIGTNGSAWAVSYPDAAIQFGQLGSEVSLFHWTVAGQPPSSRTVELSSPIVNSQDNWFTPVSIAVPSPMTLTATILGFAPYAMQQEDGASWSEGVARCFAAGAGPALTIIWLLGAVAAWFTWRHARREDTSEAEILVWTGFVLLIGPAGYLGYRFHRRWPRRIPCPTGGHTLPADHFACPTCHADWPLQALKGIEVLEPAEA